ncbi:MAG: hypothetical protein M3209_17500 [Acidobacteriota bacterium]|nr:hypothetical protein [Acidobacteriota bacterium]
MGAKLTHIHFGAGNLGIGLTLPAISEHVRLAVIQKASQGDIPSEGDILLHNSSEYSRKMIIITDKSSEEYKTRIYTEWLEGGEKPLFIYSNIWENYSYIIEKANSISCSLKYGQGTLATLLNELNFSSNPSLFPFENDLNVSLKNHSKINLVNVLSDRICTDRAMNARDRVFSVKAENKGLIVINSTDEQTTQIFSETKNIDLLFKVDDSFNYYYERKINLVNGLHFILATLSYAFLMGANIPVPEWKNQLLPVLIKILHARELPYSSHIENYIDGHIMLLILSYSNVIQEEHELNDIEDYFDYLRAFYEGVLSRLETPDYLGRILDYNNPIKVVEKSKKFLDSTRLFIMAAASRLDEMPIRRRPFSEDIVESISFLEDCIRQIGAQVNLHYKERLNELEASKIY